MCDASVGAVEIICPALVIASIAVFPERTVELMQKQSAILLLNFVLFLMAVTRQ